ncbi:MAG TPA: hypothetical protein VEG66_05765, partial [Thermoplasmata archaeon]|nr:hypothetical protein [Thermoplasmata archaeon]
MADSPETVVEVSPSPGGPAEELARTLGVSRDTAERLVKAGRTTAAEARELSPDALADLGIAPEEAARVRSAPATPDADAPTEAPASGGDSKAAASDDSDRIVERWAGTVRRSDRTRRRRTVAAPKESTEVLRKWVDGDDRVMEEWIRSSEADRPTAVTPVVTAPAPTPTQGPAPAAPVEVAVPASVTEREETVVRWLTGLLDRVKSDQFDPSTMIQEVQDLQRQLFDERAKRKQLEDEVEHVKRGSIAVIKYVRSHEAKERELALRAKDDEIAEMKLRLLALEGVDGRRATAPAPVAAPAEGGSAPAESAATAPVLEREETVVRWLTGLLDRVKSDQFDPSMMIQEAQDLQRQLFDERTKRKQLEDEVEHVKRGSIAVIKYVRSHEAKERELALRAKDDEIAEMKLRLLALEGVDGRRATAPAPVVAPAEGGSAPAEGTVNTADAVEKATRELDQRLREEFAQREHDYIERETELRRRIVQLEDEVEHVKRGSIAVIKYVRSHEAKERELALRAKDDEIAEMKLRLLALEGVGAPKSAPTVAAPPAAEPAPSATAGVA